MGDVDDALKIFEELYKKAPGAPNVNTSLAAIMSRKGDRERAKKLLLQALTLDSGRFSGSLGGIRCSRTNQAEDRKDDAIADLRSAARAFLGNLEALNMLSEQFKLVGMGSGSV